MLRSVKVGQVKAVKFRRGPVRYEVSRSGKAVASCHGLGKEWCCWSWSGKAVADRRGGVRFGGARSWRSILTQECPCWTILAWTLLAIT